MSLSVHFLLALSPLSNRWWVRRISSLRSCFDSSIFIGNAVHYGYPIVGLIGAPHYLTLFRYIWPEMKRRRRSRQGRRRGHTRIPFSLLVYKPPPKPGGGDGEYGVKANGDLLRHARGCSLHPSTRLTVKHGGRAVPVSFSSSHQEGVHESPRTHRVEALS